MTQRKALKGSGDMADVPREQWYWSGYAGHFCGSAKCAFHLCTRIGDALISTVGDYRPSGEREEIGLGCTFETFVFQVRDGEGPEGDHVDYAELDTSAYNDSREAEAGHYAMCDKWAKAARQKTLTEQVPA
jgi:hypothetical protein